MLVCTLTVRLINKDLWIVSQGNFWDLNDKGHVHFSLYLYEDF